MSENDYGAFNTTLRFYENQLLTQADYQDLLQMDNLEDVTAYLKKRWQWTGNAKDKKESKSVSALIENRSRRILNWLVEQAPEPAIVEWLLLPNTYHNIKVLYKQHLIQQKDATSISWPSFYPIYQIRQALDPEEPNPLPGIYQAFIQRLQTEYGIKQKFNHLNIMTDRAVNRHRLKSDETIQNETLKQLAVKEVDQSNGLVFMRALEHGMSKQAISALLDDTTVRPKEDWLGLCDMKASDRQATLIEWFDGENQLTKDSAISDWEQFFKYQMGQLLSQAKMEVFGPLPMVAYYYALDNEKTNLKLIETGINNQIDPQTIQQRMCVYDGI